MRARSANSWSASRRVRASSSPKRSSGPISPQAVYVAPPDDHRKERFRSLRARVIRQGAEFKPDAELEAFVGELKGVTAA